MGRLELPASCSQSKRATNCATPGYRIFQLWSNMWSTPIFDQLPARGKVLSAQVFQGFPGFLRAVARTWASRSQSRRATNCATPGYEIFQLWSNMWSTPIFDQLPARGKVLSAQVSQGFPGFPRTSARTRASRSQTVRESFLNNLQYFSDISAMFRLLFRTFAKHCFRVFRIQKWLFLWSETLRLKGFREL